MTTSESDLARLRLRSQGVAAPLFGSPAEVVRGLGAVQAQDYLGSLWALGLRLPRGGQAEVERAVDAGEIVRTWPLRGTLHFVAAEDVRWMLSLLGPRTVARAAHRYRQLGLDEETFAKAGRVLVGALEGGRRLTRPELAAELNRGGIPTDGQRLIHLLNRSALEGLTCYAARRGKQFTFALLDEWAPSSRRLEGDEALAELAARYFKGHGPATLQDFVWWSGLTTADARAGLEMAGAQLLSEVYDGQTYWLATSTKAARPDSTPAAKVESPAAHLLPAFDEYTVAYKDRAAVIHPSFAERADAASAVLAPAVVLDGRVVGTWKRVLKGGLVLVEMDLSFMPGKDERAALIAASRRYGEFLGLSSALA